MHGHISNLKTACKQKQASTRVSTETARSYDWIESCMRLKKQTPRHCTALMEPGMSRVYSRLRLQCSGVHRGLLSACKWIFCVHRFCEDCLLAALTVSAVPAVIDEPGGTLHPRLEEREGENCCSIISHDLTRLIMPPQIPARHYSDKAASFA